jgi:hypothetical protein
LNILSNTFSDSILLTLFTWAIGITISLVGLILIRSVILKLQNLKQSNYQLESLVRQKSNELEASKSSLQRTSFLLDRRDKQLRKQQNILFDLTKDKAINQGDFIVAVQNITRTGSYALGVERVSIWLFNKDRTILHCLDLYQQSLNLHTESDVLTADAYPSFFEAILKERTIAAEDIQEDEVFTELFSSFFTEIKFELISSSKAFLIIIKSSFVFVRPE